MKKYALIVAGGSGSRMESATPKQFLVLEGKPMLMHTLEVFFQYDKHIHIILVLPEVHRTNWEKLIDTYNFDVPHQITSGGATRFNSVKNGLNTINSKGLVAIHDGARPLVTAHIIEQTFKMAHSHGNGIAAVALKDSIRQVTSEGNHAVDRSNYYAIQTPQTFRIELIKQAFDKASSSSFTDDASVAESNGEKIILVDGSYDNLKITTPEDLIIAQSILSNRK